VVALGWIVLAAMIAGLFGSVLRDRVARKR
jgi:hypothetical protein